MESETEKEDDEEESEMMINTST